ncbi:DUF882 domain-containing protein [Aurantimonas sp. A2-1-M11]|uniref:DUF882 domain-containing protein n=1 Tax=Aurantimonas sp. A2-1-M11 TaxID=3113712 RepID=UPI002F935966
MFGHTARAGRSAWRIATFAALALFATGVVTTAKAETRVLKFYNLHTKEKGSFSYKSNGRYNNGELKKINWFLRDWRKGEQTQIDPRLLDLIWEAYRQSGSNGLINVVSSYRSPATNSMLRSRSSGVAKSSQHTLGKALDFFIPDVPLAKMREIGLKMQVGGVGYYPKSGSPFVHFDVGNARHWPRMNRKQLMAVFPNGNTVHVPSDGKPLPGYQQAMASYKQRRGSSSIQVANASSGSSGGGKTLLAMLFGGGSDEAEDEAESAPAPRAPVRAAPAQQQVQVAAVVPQSRPTQALPGGVAVPVGDRFDVGAPASAPAPAQTEVAALDTAQIPVPTWAPGRAVPSEVGQPAQATRDDAVSTLVAALEEQATETLASGQLAYAVPTPANRPPFEAVLTEQPAAASGSTIAKAAPAQETMKAVEMAAKAPTPRPQIDPQAAKPVQALMTAAAASPSKPRPQPVATAEAPAVIAGKGGRVLNAAVPQSRKPKVLDPQEAIASRFQIAALVSDTDSRTGRLATAEPDASRLVGNLPRTLFASGFAPTTPSGKSDRFSGSAVNFLPMVKVGQ